MKQNAPTILFQILEILFGQLIEHVSRSTTHVESLPTWVPEILLKCEYSCTTSQGSLDRKHPPANHSSIPGFSFLIKRPATVFSACREENARPLPFQSIPKYRILTPTQRLQNGSSTYSRAATESFSSSGRERPTRMRDQQPSARQCYWPTSLEKKCPTTAGLQCSATTGGPASLF